MRPLLDPRVTCAGCGAQSKALFLFGKHADADAWAAGGDGSVGG
jgi:hypothetical protein